MLSDNPSSIDLQNIPPRPLSISNRWIINSTPDHHKREYHWSGKNPLTKIYTESISQSSGRFIRLSRLALSYRISGRLIRWPLIKLSNDTVSRIWILWKKKKMIRKNCAFIIKLLGLLPKKFFWFAFHHGGRGYWPYKQGKWVEIPSKNCTHKLTPPHPSLPQ